MRHASIHIIKWKAKDF